MSEQVFLTVQELAATITDLPLDSHERIVVAVAGGTNSGKTTLTKMLANVEGEHMVHFPQDTFQLGYGFSGIETSIYRADDPTNFALGECAVGLASLKKGEDTVVPLITPLRYERHGTQVIHPKPLILWEGMYAVLTPELEALADKIFYVDAPFALRIMRRITRFIEERGGNITDEQAVISPTHMLSSILLAEKNFVITQRPKADYIVRFDESLIDKEFKALEEATANLSRAESLGALHGSKQLGEGSVDLHEQGLAITYQGRQIYAIQLDATTIVTAKDNFDYILEN
jgi:uridine kinase